MTRSEVTVYIDFLCPWAYRGSLWLAEVEKAGRIQVSWRFFSLSQNHQAREGQPGPPVWETNRGAAGLPAFLAATAARLQGDQPFNRFREGLQRAGLSLRWSERLVSWLAREGFDARYGARPLQRVLERRAGLLA